jgi:hypothetical protein
MQVRSLVRQHVELEIKPFKFLLLSVVVRFKVLIEVNA